MGWGSTVPVKFQEAVYTDVLLEVNVPVISDRECSKMSDFSRHWHVCAMTEKGGRDSCKGDSGGPLVCPLLSSADSSQPVWSLVGLTSHGDPDCGRKGAAGIYTRVYRFLYWIEKNTQDGVEWWQVQKKKFVFIFRTIKQDIKPVSSVGCSVHNFSFVTMTNFGFFSYIIFFMLIMFITYQTVNSFEDFEIRIVGGTFSRENEWPFMAAVMRRGMQMCGGVVWDRFNIITAAHCV